MPAVIDDAVERFFRGPRVELTTRSPQRRDDRVFQYAGGFIGVKPLFTETGMPSVLAFQNTSQNIIAHLVWDGVPLRGHIIQNAVDER